MLKLACLAPSAVIARLGVGLWLFATVQSGLSPPSSAGIWVEGHMYVIWAEGLIYIIWLEGFSYAIWVEGLMYVIRLEGLIHVI